MEAFLLQYGYWIFFLAVMIFGPTVTLIGGFFIFIGHFNVYILMPVIVVTDVGTDVFYYLLGKRAQRSSNLDKYIQHFGFFRRYVEDIKNIWMTNSFMPIFLGKRTFSLSIPIIMSAGALHVPFRKFMVSSLYASCIQTSILLFVGYHLGNGYMIANKQMQYSMIIVTSFVVLFLLGIGVLQKKAKESKRKNNSQK